MRPAPVLIALLLAGSAPLAAAQSDAFALQAAVAPAQLLFDAAAQVVDLAVSEATRDGTPDAAIELRRGTEDFARDLARDWEVSEQATHREATLAALPVARRLPIVLGDVTDDVARLATATERCARQQLTADDLTAILGSRALVQATAAELLAVARAPPPGVSGARLAGAASSLQTWSETFEAIRECSPVPRDTEPALLAFQAQPSVIHPTGLVRVRGVTNAAGPVVLDASDLELNVSVPLAERVFEHTFQVPLEAEYGAVIVRARAGELTATRVIAIERADVTLTVSGPVRAEPGALANYSIRLTSGVPERTANATLTLAGDVQQVVQLEDGRARVQVLAPASTRRLEFSVSFAGDRVVASDREDVTLFVGLAPPASRGGGGNATGNATGNGSTEGEENVTFGEEAGEGGSGLLRPAPPLTPPSNRAIEVALLVLVLALVAYAVHGPLPKRAGPPPVPFVAAPAPLPRLVPFRAGLVAQFVRLASTLRARGLVAPGTTARKMRPLLAQMGMEGGEIVRSFERVRYGGAPEPSWTRALRARFARAWSRLREAPR